MYANHLVHFISPGMQAGALSDNAESASKKEKKKRIDSIAESGNTPP